MLSAHNGEIKIAYETFGSETDPALILIHGLGSSMLVWHEELCAGFTDRGFFVLRMDLRDSGLSTVVADSDSYTLADMAADVIAVLDAAGCSRAIVCGYSLGGMVAQTVAADFGHRVAALVSVSSHTGELGIAEPAPEVWAALTALTAPAAATIDEQIESDLVGYRLWSNPEWRNEQAERQYLERSYRRAWHPGASKRQIDAALNGGSRANMLRGLDLPALVIHGAADPLIPPELGSRTAELITGAEYLEIEAMGHELPPQVWAAIISAVTSLSSRVAW